MKEFYVPRFLSIFKRKQKELSCPYDLLVIFACGDTRSNQKNKNKIDENEKNEKFLCSFDKLNLGDFFSLEN